MRLPVFFPSSQNFVNTVIILYRNFFYYLYLPVLKFTSRRATNIKKMICHTTPYFTSVYIFFVNSKSFFNASGRPNMLLTTTFAGYQINSFSIVVLQIPLVLYFRLVAKQVKSGKTTKTFLQMSRFLLHSFIEHSLCLVVLENNDVDKISLRSLFLFYVTLMVFCGKISSICWLLHKIGKWFLMMVLSLGSKELYCVIKLHEVERMVLSNLGFLASSLVSF